MPNETDLRDERPFSCQESSLPAHLISPGLKVVSFTGKGGSGKTDTTASIAVAATEQGFNVVALDLDPRGDLAAWSMIRDGSPPRIMSVNQHSFARVLRNLRGGDDIDLLLIDTPGERSHRSNMAMNASDICLVTARPSLLDVRAACGFLEQASRLDRHAAVILTQCLWHPGRIEEARALFAKYNVDSGPPIGARVDHQDAIAGGYGVTEHNPYGTAAGEIRALWDWLHASLWMSKRES